MSSDEETEVEECADQFWPEGPYRTQPDDIVLAMVNNDPECLHRLLVVSVESHGMAWRVRLRLNNSTHFTVICHPADDFNINIEESDESKRPRASRDLKVLTGVQTGSRADALSVYEAVLLDLGICARVTLTPDVLQTRNKSYPPKPKLLPLK